MFLRALSGVSARVLSGNMVALTEYEQQRQENIERNEQRMRALGIPERAAPATQTLVTAKHSRRRAPPAPVAVVRVVCLMDMQSSRQHRTSKRSSSQL